VTRWIAASLSLFLFWLLLNGSVAPDVLIAGAAVSLTIAWALPAGMPIFGEFRWTSGAVRAAFAYVPFFTWELVKSNLRLAAIVLKPSLPLQPGIVKVRTRLKSPMGRLLLANSITLTPGTLTVELTGEWMYIHWVTVESDDIEAATQSIVAGFERYLEVMYG
jgi:multicomponent Na+:H+ antiporter subunit E